MTSTPHFALAQNPETGEWALMMWRGALGWCAANSLLWIRWHATRLEAVAAIRDEIDGIEHFAWAMPTLNQLVEHERNMTAGGDATVQTITTLKEATE